MASLPPPTRLQVTTHSHSDPWVEQSRRQAEHRAQRRRRRRRWLAPLVVLVVLSAGAAAGFLVNDAMVDRRADELVTSIETAPLTVSDDSPEPTVPPDRLVVVDQVWLIDRGDGVFDWGVSVRTPAIAPTRSGVVIDVRLFDADDTVVEETSGVVDGIGPESTGTVAGRFADAAAMPVRLEFDVAVGVVSNDRALGDLLSVRALERTSTALLGRIRSDVADPITDVTMVLLWSDEDGEVVAAVPVLVDRVRPAVDARFDIDLLDEVVPDGRPDSVVWTR